ncbi:MAG TPA: hypothetical protein VG964_02040, partial [Candidatus Saccharimonadales bacterium]|nr:hypothetical protein [Candidatus Saccharimonadales bacterium]
MRRARNIFLLVALASLVAVASASAHATGAANRVSFGVQQSQLGYVGKAAYGDAVFTLMNPTASPVYDLTVWITNGCSSGIMPTAPLSLLAKPPHMNPAVESLTG